MGRLFLGEAVEGETVGIEELEDGWRIWLGPLILARLDARQINDPKAERDKRGKGRWRAQLLDGSGSPRETPAAAQQPLTGHRTMPGSRFSRTAGQQAPASRTVSEQQRID